MHADASLLNALSDSALRKVAGPIVFQRGVAYAADGRAALLAGDNREATFEVAGTQLYRVVLHFDEPELLVSCDCPHALDGRGCKHLVAAALTWRSRLGGEGLPARLDSVPPRARSERAEKAAQTRAANRDRLKSFLTTQPAEELASRLWRRAEIDSNLMAELKAWHARERAADDPKALKRAIMELLALSSNHFVAGRAVWAWAERALQTEPLLLQQLERSPEVARGIAEQALRRVYAIAQRVDDSDGEVGRVMHMLIGIIIAALERAPPAASWAQRFIDLLNDDPFGIWEIDAVLNVAGDDVARGFSRSVEQGWAEVAGRAEQDDEVRHRRRLLRELKLVDLRRRGDVAALLEFMKESTRSLFDHEELIRAYEAHGRHREAMALAESACRQFDNHSVVEDLLLEFYRRDGWDDEALAICRRRFNEQPTVANYQALLDAGAVARAEIAALRREALVVAAAHDLEETNAPRPRFDRRASESGPIVTAAAALLIHDGALIEAFELVQPPNRCAPRLLEMLAARLPPDQDASAFALLDRRVTHEMRHAQSPYRDALRLVSAALSRLELGQRNDYLDRLRARYKAKRNFIAGLSGNIAGSKIIK